MKYTIYNTPTDELLEVKFYNSDETCNICNFLEDRPCNVIHGNHLCYYCFDKVYFRLFMDDNYKDPQLTELFMNPKGIRISR